MGAPWIKIRHNLPMQPEVIGMADLLGIDIDSVVGKLIRVWSWADDVTTNGCARGVTCSRMDDIARFAGFAAAMAKVGWLIVLDDGVQIPNFERHCGESAKRRAQAANRMRLVRDRKKSGENPVAEMLRNGCADGATKAQPDKNRIEIEEEEEETHPLPLSSHSGQPSPKKPERARSKANSVSPPVADPPAELSAEDLAAAFEQFWAAYPRRQARDLTRRNWCALMPDAAMVAAIMASLEAQKASDQWREEGGRFVPRADRWLAERRWEDQVSPRAPPAEPAADRFPWASQFLKGADR